VLARFRNFLKYESFLDIQEWPVFCDRFQSGLNQKARQHRHNMTRQGKFSAKLFYWMGAI
jgi:hypothetical protein